MGARFIDKNTIEIVAEETFNMCLLWLGQSVEHSVMKDRAFFLMAGLNTYLKLTKEEQAQVRLAINERYGLKL